MSSCVNNNNNRVLNSDAISRGIGRGPQPSVQLKNGELTINGTKGADNLQVVKNGNNLEVRSGDQLLGSFPADRVNSLKVNGGKGDDQIHVDVGPDIAVRVHGGKGNDQISVQNARDAFIDGGKGRDQITGRNLAGGTIRGGKGTDCINLFNSSLLDVNGGKGNDHIRLDRVFLSSVNGGKGKDHIEQVDRESDRVRNHRSCDSVQRQRFAQQALVTGLWLGIGLAVGLR